MFDFMISINKLFLTKERIVNMSKTICYDKYSIVPRTVKNQAPH